MMMSCFLLTTPLVLVLGCVHIYPADAYIELVASDVYENLSAECSSLPFTKTDCHAQPQFCESADTLWRIFFMMLLVTK